MNASSNPSLHRTPASLLSSLQRGARPAPVSSKPLGSTKSHFAFSCILTLGSLACASRVPSVKEYRDGLSLMASVSRSAISVGEPLDFTLTLKNTSAKTLEACLGESRTYHIFGTRS